GQAAYGDEEKLDMLRIPSMGLTSKPINHRLRENNDMSVSSSIVLLFKLGIWPSNEHYDYCENKETELINDYKKWFNKNDLDSGYVWFETVTDSNGHKRLYLKRKPLEIGQWNGHDLPFVHDLLDEFCYRSDWFFQKYPNGINALKYNDGIIHDIFHEIKMEEDLRNHFGRKIKYRRHPLYIPAQIRLNSELMSKLSKLDKLDHSEISKYDTAFEFADNRTFDQMIQEMPCLRAVQYSEPVFRNKFVPIFEGRDFIELDEEEACYIKVGDDEFKIADNDDLRNHKRPLYRKETYEVLGYAKPIEGSDGCNAIYLCMDTIKEASSNCKFIPPVNSIEHDISDTLRHMYRTDLYSFTTGTRGGADERIELVEKMPVYLSILAHELAHCFSGHVPVGSKELVKKTVDQEQMAQTMASIFFMDKNWSYFILQESMYQPCEYQGMPLYGIGKNAENVEDVSPIF
ncbi:MAG: hypothetical protein HUJ69_00920, partial [Lachnospiraceae bacterium]|nr:hypothetical protein [Lachnospiraceae bacterium]